MKLKIYLDTRATKKGEQAPLKLSIAHNNGTALLSLGISVLPSQFNSKSEKVEYHPNKIFINNFLAQRKNEVEKIALDLSLNHKLATLSATELKNIIKEKLDSNGNQQPTNLFIDVWHKFVAQGKKLATQQLYAYTFGNLQKFCPKLDKLTFEDFTLSFITEFNNYLIGINNKNNTRNAQYKCIKAVFNYAILNDITTNYPFRKFKIRQLPTAKRALTVEQLREFINAKIPIRATPFRDYFVLTFCLIGINAVDLFHCDKTAISNQNRLEYVRAKTYKRYSIKIEPETAEYLKRYQGDKSLLYFREYYNNEDGFQMCLYKWLKRLMPAIPTFSLYWARHTWATIAASLDIPKEVIAHALGHSSNTVTDVYIDFDERKVDIANRKVLDYVFYNKM